MELIDSYKMKRECTLSNRAFAQTVINYIHDFRAEHWLDTVKVKTEFIAGAVVRYVHSDDGKKSEKVYKDGHKYAYSFSISVVENCFGDLRILFEDTNGEITVIPVLVSDFGSAAEKLVKLIGDTAEDDNGVHYPYVEATIDINVKAYD